MALAGLAGLDSTISPSTGAGEGLPTCSESPTEPGGFWADFEALVHLFFQHPVQKLDILHTSDQRCLEGN